MLTIVCNQPDTYQAFAELNLAWIKKYFHVEESDRALADNPAIYVDAGGYVLAAVKDDIVLGAVALVEREANVYELTKMAVDPNFHGQGIANKLMLAIFDKLEELNAEMVYLVSNTKLKSAINLYKKYGFETVHLGPHHSYKRCDIIMEKPL
ncbi:GNAT family N-acetyltransferase [Thalassotalea agarivorans]|uniref:Ribosomal protein S18 acetylase RimI n=1 Tax=Thalassotalea agarivorans TaxID=349064 RepID=A0A1I0CKG8_THASX|nr:GNAT family N-acetyltransferase [Thalassotalea agarivorans]SET20164.1 Ribosomal protein S18 acetylase RimI [Thalassotalea agarivorans]